MLKNFVKAIPHLFSISALVRQPDSRPVLMLKLFSLPSCFVPALEATMQVVAPIITCKLQVIYTLLSFGSSADLQIGSR